MSDVPLTLGRAKCKTPFSDSLTWLPLISHQTNHTHHQKSTQGGMSPFSGAPPPPATRSQWSPERNTYQFGREVRLSVAVSEPAVLAQAPGVEVAAAGDGGRVRAAGADVAHAPGAQRHHLARLEAGLARAVAQLAVIALAPGEHLGRRGGLSHR